MHSFQGKTDAGVNGEMLNLILNLVGFDNSFFSEERKSVWVTSMTFLRDFLAKTKQNSNFCLFFNDVIKQTLLQFDCTFPEKPQISCLIVWKNSVRPLVGAG